MNPGPAGGYAASMPQTFRDFSPRRYPRHNDAKRVVWLNAAALTLWALGFLGSSCFIDGAERGATTTLVLRVQCHDRPLAKDPLDRCFRRPIG